MSPRVELPTTGVCRFPVRRWQREASFRAAGFPGGLPGIPVRRSSGHIHGADLSNPPQAPNAGFFFWHSLFRRAHACVKFLCLDGLPPGFDYAAQSERLLDGDFSCRAGFQDLFSALCKVLGRAHRQRSRLQGRVARTRKDVREQGAQHLTVPLYSLQYRFVHQRFGVLVQQLPWQQDLLVATATRSPAAALIALLEGPSSLFHLFNSLSRLRWPEPLSWMHTSSQTLPLSQTRSGDTAPPRWT